jgi:glycosyltransferase involved in cell wall biosynthesis
MASSSFMNDSISGVVLVNGTFSSVQGPRARALFEGSAKIVYKENGRLGSVRETWKALEPNRQKWIYCIDMGFPSSLLAAVRRRLSPQTKLVYEIGDPARALLANQARSSWEIACAHQADRRLPANADQLVFRGSFLAEYFKDIFSGKDFPPWIWLPDGVDCELFSPQRQSSSVLSLRRAHNLEGRFIVGLVGNIHHNPSHSLFYGWELAEALALIPRDIPITGVIVGDGPGWHVLKETRTRLGLEDRLLLVGRVPHHQVPLWMNVFDLGLSTQTDDPVGWGRTTAKLPEYLACGTPVLCSEVGEAFRLLRDSGQTLTYTGMRDTTYPSRLAKEIVKMSSRDLKHLQVGNRNLALRHFDYTQLREKLATFLPQI